MRTLLLIPVLLALAGPAVAASPIPVETPTESRPLVQPVNIINGNDDRDSLLLLGPSLGLSAEEITRIRTVSGYVGCLSPSPSVGSAALFLDNSQILTAAHVFFEPSGKRRWKCFFKNQSADPVMIDLMVDDANARFGSKKPKPGSNNDYAVVRLVEPIKGARPFPVSDVPVQKGDALIVVTAHPAAMAKTVDRGIPVVQGCEIMRVPRSSEKTSFYRSDCDATGASSGGMNLSRVGGELVFRGINITTGPWQDPKYKGAPYDEKGGSVTTALGTDAAILAAGRALQAAPWPPAPAASGATP
ncbi:MAG: trypsin-like peptidase domain-containing protein [Rhizobiales bacterium]|nr:trypsin-like peptidase domain-containing protein [Hyphomicrobiales bacterium]